MKNDKWITPLNVIAALLIAVLIITASVTAVLFDRSAYASYVQKNDLASALAMDEEAIIENYDALIDYNSVFFSGSLEFPTFPMSAEGRVHFEEVKDIFVVIQIALIISAIGTAVCCAILLRRKRMRFLALGGILALVIPAVCGGVMSLAGWDRFFVLFHKVFFNNDFWVFDEQTDPVILILPDGFFLNCLIRIIAAIVTCAAILIVLYFISRRFRERLPRRRYTPHR